MENINKETPPDSYYNDNFEFKSKYDDLDMEEIQNFLYDEFIDEDDEYLHELKRYV